MVKLIGIGDLFVVQKVYVVDDAAILSARPRNGLSVIFLKKTSSHPTFESTCFIDI